MSDDKALAAAIQVVTNLVGRIDITRVKPPAIAMASGRPEFAAFAGRTSEIERIVDQAIAIYKGEVSRPSSPTPSTKPVEVIARRGEVARVPAGPGRNPKDRGDPSELKLSAPYRFIALNDQIVEPEAAANHATPRKGGFCGEIDVEFVVETPLLIGHKDIQSGIVSPLTCGRDGAPILPGPTLRGLIRSNMETVAGARLGYVNINKRAALRDFDHLAYKNRTRESEVKAGWLYKTKNKAGAPCYAIASIGHYWSHIRITDMLSHHHIALSPNRWCQKDLQQKYDELGMVSGGTINFTKKFKFSDVVNHVTPQKDYRLISEPGGSYDGFYVFSGPMPQGNTKKLEYVFYDVEPETRRIIRDEIWDAFDQVHSRTIDMRREPEGSWAILKPLVEAGVKIPIFYSGDIGLQNKDFAFGLTRLFKVPHKNSIGDILLEKHRQHLPRIVQDAEDEETGRFAADFVENLFGHVLEEERLRKDKDFKEINGLQLTSRVSFRHATLTDETAYEVVAPVDLVQMAPRPSFGPFYLRSRTEKDYSSTETPELAGRKTYLPRMSGSNRMNGGLQKIQSLADAQLRAITAMGEGVTLANVASHLRFMIARDGKELRFRSRIRLHNVTAAELGALLFVLTHGGDFSKTSRFMLGRGKAFGAGQTRLDRLALTLEPNDEIAAALISPPQEQEIATGTTGLLPPFQPDTDKATENASLLPFLDEFCATMRDKGLSNFPRTRIVEEWLGSSDPEMGQNEEGAGAGTSSDRLSYLPVGSFRTIQKQTKPWPGYNAPKRLVKQGETEDGRYLAPPRKRFWS